MSDRLREAQIALETTVSLDRDLRPDDRVIDAWAISLRRQLGWATGEVERLETALAAVEDLVVLAEEWLKNTAGLRPHYVPPGDLPSHRQRVTGAVVKFNAVCGLAVPRG